MTKKVVLLLLVVALLMCATAVSAGKPGNQNSGRKGGSGEAGKSNVGQLFLFEKDYSDPAWPIVVGGAWGKMEYNLSGSTFDFVFTGHRLEDGLDYTLIYYPDPWPGSGLICLGSGTATDCDDTTCDYACVHITGSVDTGDLPIDADENAAAKIWLVLSEDVDCDGAAMVGWNPGEYLFEHHLITFDDTDVTP